MALTASAGGQKKPPPPPPPLVVDVVSFNIRYLNNRDTGDNHWTVRKTLTAEAMRHFDADIIGVQEVLKRQLDFLVGELPDYAMVGVGRDDGQERGEYSAIFYRPTRFEVPESGTFWLSDTPEVPGSKTWGNQVVRICTWARLAEKKPDKPRTLYVFNTHFDHQVQPSREKAVRLIVQRIGDRTYSGDPVVLMGDFNASEQNPAIRYLKGEAVELAGGDGTETTPLNFVDTFRLQHPDTTEARTLHSWRGTREGPKIDYIFAEPGVEVREAYIDDFSRDGLYPSDHFPVRARLAF